MRRRRFMAAVGTGLAALGLPRFAWAKPELFEFLPGDVLEGTFRAEVRAVQDGHLALEWFQHDSEFCFATTITSTEDMFQRVDDGHYELIRYFDPSGPPLEIAAGDVIEWWDGLRNVPFGAGRIDDRWTRWAPELIQTGHVTLIQGPIHWKRRPV